MSGKLSEDKPGSGRGAALTGKDEEGKRAEGRKFISGSGIAGGNGVKALAAAVSEPG